MTGKKLNHLYSSVGSEPVILPKEQETFGKPDEDMLKATEEGTMTVCHGLSSDLALIDMSGFDCCEFMHEPLRNTCFHIRKEESG